MSKLKRHKYDESLTYEWVHDMTPETGAYFSTSEGRVEAYPNSLWVGFQTFLLAVKNRKLGMIICVAPDYKGFCGVVDSTISHTLTSRKEHYVRNDEPWREHLRFNNHSHKFIGQTKYQVAEVDRISEELIDCDLATLTPLVQARWERAYRTAARSKDKGYPWVPHMLPDNPNARYDDPPICHGKLIKDQFALLGIPWIEQAETDLIVAQTAKRLASN